MSEEAARRRLSGYDFFGIVSTVIGFVVDVLTLSGIFIATQTQQQPGAVLWIGAGLSIVYTTTLGGFYARRFFVARQKRPGIVLTQKAYSTIEGGATAVNNLVGLPLCFTYGLLLALSVPSGNPPVEPSQMSDRAAALFALFGFGWLPILIILLGTHHASKALYKAFDIEYDPDPPNQRH